MKTHICLLTKSKIHFYLIIYIIYITMRLTDKKNLLKIIKYNKLIKQILAITILWSTPVVLNAQTIKNVPWMHRSDMVLGSEVIRLGVKEIYQHNLLTYKFESSLNGKVDTFDILSDDFVKGEYLENLFLVKLRQSYDRIKSVPIPDSTQSKKLIREINQRSGVLNEVNKMEVESQYENLTKSNDIDQLNNLLTQLYDLSDDDASKDWMAEKIKELATVKKEKEDDLKKDLESNGRAYLNIVLDILTKRALEGGKVGTLYITDTVSMRWHIYCDTLNKKLHYKPLAIKAVEIKFESGQIASIAVKGYIAGYKDKIFTFHNRKPIAFSTKYDVSFDYHILKDIRIFCKDKDADGYYILLSDLLYNDYEMSNYTENYSPIDTVVSLLPMQPGRVIFRERITDILQARVFSDVIGYGDNHPNGLVQIEFSKLVNLKSGSAWRKTRIEKKCDNRNNPKKGNDNGDNTYPWFKRNRYRKIHTYEWFRYTIPSIAITKIEQNDKYLDVALNTDSTGTISTIDMLRYANFRAGIQHNIFMHGRPEYQSNFTWDVSVYSLLTGTSTNMTKLDSATLNGDTTFFSEKIQNQSRALSFLISPLDFNWNLYPHSNYRFNFNYRLQYLLEANERYEFPKKEQKLGQWVHQMGMTAGIRFNEANNGEMFARVIVNLNAVYLSQNYYQFQVGYTFKLFSRKPELKNRSIFY